VIDHAGLSAVFSPTSEKNYYGQRSNVKTQSQKKSPTPTAYDITRRNEEEMFFKLKFTFPLRSQRKNKFCSLFRNKRLF